MPGWRRTPDPATASEVVLSTCRARTPEPLRQARRRAARPALEIPALSPESGRRARSQLARWFVGAVGEGDAKDFTALGDTVNTGSRLTSLAAAGEFLISAETAETGGLETAGLERRTLELRGRKQTIDAWVCKGSEVSLAPPPRNDATIPRYKLQIRREAAISSRAPAARTKEDRCLIIQRKSRQQPI
jgi:class 3 adenylate cyclase